MTITLVQHNRPMPAGSYVPGGNARVGHTVDLRREPPTAAETYAMAIVRRAIVRAAMTGPTHPRNAVELADVLRFAAADV
jgi:hypothetical protein